MFAKSEVNGQNTNEVWRYLRRNSELHNSGNGRSRVIPWNFTKFVTSPDGTDIQYFNPRAQLRDIRRVIEQKLAK